jgi:hypothetical protein
MTSCVLSDEADGALLPLRWPSAVPHRPPVLLPAIGAIGMDGYWLLRMQHRGRAGSARDPARWGGDEVRSHDRASGNDKDEQGRGYR